MHSIILDKVKGKLIKIKEILVDYIDIVEFDYDSIEYLIDTIDYLVQGKIPCNSSIMNIILEDVMLAGSFHKSKSLLKVSCILKEILEVLENV